MEERRKGGREVEWEGGWTPSIFEMWLHLCKVASLDKTAVQYKIPELHVHM